MTYGEPPHLPIGTPPHTYRNPISRESRYIVFKGNRYCHKCSPGYIQTNVESLKNSGSFGKEEQLIAFEKAKVIFASELTEDLKTFITQNYGDLQTWISNQIEATIYKLKN